MRLHYKGSVEGSSAVEMNMVGCYLCVCLLNGMADRLISEHKDDEKMQIQASVYKTKTIKQEETVQSSMTYQFLQDKIDFENSHSSIMK